MIRQLFILFFSFFFFSLAAQNVDKQSVSLIPYPVNIEEKEGCFVFTDKTVVVVEDEDLKAVTEDFLSLFSQSAGFTPKLKKGKKGNMHIQKDGSLQEEAYVLEVNPENIWIKASGVKGAFYALQTLRQLLPSEIESGSLKEGVAWQVPSVSIKDEPRFGYRGLMVDVARRFIEKEHLFRIIDTMGMLKLNKLHLHLTDDNGWRLEIKQYPLLTSIGSKNVERKGQAFPERRNARQGEPLVDGGFYTQEDMKEIIAYATNRQIEVIPEIAMPGHSNAALSAYPLLACPVVDKYIGAIPGLGADHTNIAYCAGNEEVFTFLEHIVDEVVDLFPSQYIHVGGDAIRNTHWEECPLCRERMMKERLDNEMDLLGYFMRRMDRYIRGKGRKVMGWEEVMDANLSKGAVVFDWHGYGHGAVKAGKQGHDFIMAPTGTMYLNRYQGPQWQEPVLAFNGGNTLKNIYLYEPIERYWTMSMRSHLLGIQAALWTEFCESPDDVDYLLYPRLGAVAEALWSSPIVKRWERFVPSIEAYQARWEMKGIKPSMSIYNVQHEVTPNFGDLRITLSCLHPDAEIRYTTDGSDPHEYSMLYRKPWAIKQSMTLKCATFKDGKQLGKTLVVPIQFNSITGKNMLRSNAVERRLVNGVRGSLKDTDGEWASWRRNDSITLTFDVGARKKLGRVSFGYLNDFGLAIHKPEKVEIWLSDNDVRYEKVTERSFEAGEIFREGRFVEDMDFEFEGLARYVRIILKGAGACPKQHVRPGKEAQICLDEMLIE
ncbi:MAG: family 20 glycosylhydrolase [Bacteroidaceae bacterium]|nr:family 20 glycosylhydrolase [Bacteroidaceae bacterium]